MLGQLVRRLLQMLSEHHLHRAGTVDEVDDLYMRFGDVEGQKLTADAPVPGVLDGVAAADRVG